MNSDPAAMAARQLEIALINFVAQAQHENQHLSDGAVITAMSVTIGRTLSVSTKSHGDRLVVLSNIPKLIQAGLDHQDKKAHEGAPTL